MKKIFLFLSFGFLMQIAFAQTFVSTEPSSRNVILEEYTGINCPYCPDGHRIANQIAKENPGRFWAVNVHVGGYAPTTPPNLHSDDGDTMQAYYKVTSFPSGMVNRNGVKNREQWDTYTQSYLQQPSCVNVAAKGELDFTARQLVITVEAYYTAASAKPENFLTIAMLQDNIIGPQSGGSTNPDQYLGGAGATSYRHMHILRDIITPTWGDPITETTEGSFFTKTYTYDIPEDVKNVPVLLQDLEFLVWVGETEKSNIITGNIAEIEYTNLTNIPPSAFAAEERIVPTCGDEASITLNIRGGGDPIKTLEIKYTVAKEEPQYFTWSGDREIIPLGYDTIHLPVFAMQANSSQKIEAEITKANGEDVTTLPVSVNIKKNVADAGGEFDLTFELTTDQYGSETTWKFFGPDGMVIDEAGPYEDLSSIGTTIQTYSFELLDYGCYRLEVYDSYGDGINSGSGAGGFRVYRNSDQRNILRDNGKFGAQATYMIIYEEGQAIENVDADDKLSIYPNPVSSILKIQSQEPVVNAEIFDVQGRLIMTQQGNVQELSTSELAQGIYILRVTTNNGVSVKKFTKQ